MVYHMRGSATDGLSLLGVDRCWWLWSLSFSTGSLLIFCWVVAAQTIHLEALFAKVCGGLSAEMLQADDGAYNAFSGPGHQVWRRAPCGDNAGRWLRRGRIWRPWSSSLAAEALRG